MPPRAKPRVFFDTSALVAAVWSEEGGARMLLRLAEASSITLLMSGAVLVEAELATRRKAPHTLERLAFLLDRSQVGILPPADLATVQNCAMLTGHPGDAIILAAAWAAGIDYFVTLDRQHLLGNALLEAAAPFPLGTPGDCLAWYRQQAASS